MIKKHVDDVHREAEQTQIAQALAQGTISFNAYQNYLTQKLLITRYLESRVSIPPSHTQSDSIFKDLSHFMRPGDKTIEYINSMTNESSDILWADVYVNFLGDYYGGKIIADNLTFRKKHLLPSNRSDRIKLIRSKIEPTEEFIQRARTSFKYIIDIYHEIARKSFL